MGGREYKNSPDLHGKISDNTLLICVSVNGFIWPSSMNNCITLIGANILLIKHSSRNDEDNCSAVVSMLNQPAFTEMTIEMHRVVLDTQFSYDSTFVKVSECLKVPNFISMLVVVKSSKTLLTEEAGILRGVFTVIGHPSTIKTKFIWAFTLGGLKATQFKNTVNHILFVNILHSN